MNLRKTRKASLPRLPIVNIDEASKETGLSKSYLYKMIYEGRLKRLHWPDCDLVVIARDELHRFQCQRIAKN